MQKNVCVSIIIVHYRVEEKLHKCLQSIYRLKTEHSYEIIIVDNDEERPLSKDFRKKYKDITIVGNKNTGFGAGNNKGADVAKGKYLFFLNPDTEVFPGTIDALVSFLQNNKNVGIAAPILLHENHEPFALQGLGKLTPQSGIVALSFLNKLIPNNPISKRFWMEGWDKTKKKLVETVPGTAFMMSKKLFEEVGRFDENFFLYFEEHDLCRRVAEKGYELYMVPEAKVMHLWGKSTAHRDDIKTIFRQSRFYYFKKHYGLFTAILVDVITSLRKEHILLALILMIGTYLLFHSLSTQMIFIGDQAWFYLSARDLLLHTSFPLVGIASSHPWLHQGPLWTYLLALSLWIGNFNPVAGGYLSASIGVITILAVYLVGRSMFDENTGLVSAAFYATSPLIILSMRMPYHTTPIPLLTALYLYSLFGLLHGRSYALPFSVLCLSLLYNLELATTVLAGSLAIILLYGFFKKTKWFRQTIILRSIVLALLAFIIPNIPILIYDFQHGFPQTVLFLAWIGYRVLKFFHIIDLKRGTVSDSVAFFPFVGDQLKKLLVALSFPLSLVVFLVSITAALKKLLMDYRKHIFIDYGLLVVTLTLLISILGYFLNRTASGAYSYMFFPIIILLLGVVVNQVLPKVWRKGAILFVFSVTLLNIITILGYNYFLSDVESVTLRYKEQVIKKIIKEESSNAYRLKGKGDGSQFESFLMPYEYLGWYYGHPPSERSRIVFVIEEKDGKIVVH